MPETANNFGKPTMDQEVPVSSPDPPAKRSRGHAGGPLGSERALSRFS
jgi:hypothetical protein